ncbi:MULTISPECIES: ABC transporter ATP-binding protein [Arthrobacter]|uniref:ABC transporter ATP-binding protein n=1 Tax=Arthrobacter terricola TaxID=2547396 RepID=A0A4R5K9V2_9MICC|nr:MULTISPECIES: ABC transporter ATP-binding protein [Arthrobacter]MBT8163018.1 ABC transporter ATP-binding protein/permease [Arthrobacter sp. GN70]TDF91776.1 ABC transporter ATP-binding protein [Arthrobacter terricola]
MSRAQTSSPVRMLVALARPYRRSLALLLLVSVVVVALQLAGPRLVAVGIDAAVRPASRGDYWPLAEIALALLAAGALTWVLTVVSRRGIGRVGEAVTYDLRCKVDGEFARLPIAYHERWSTGLIISRLTADVDTVSDLFANVLSGLLTSTLMCLGVVAAMLLLDPIVAGVVIASILPALVLTTWRVRRMAPTRIAERDAIAQVTADAVEPLGAVAVVQSLGTEPWHAHEFGRSSERLQKISRRIVATMSTYYGTIEAATQLAGIVALTVGALRVMSGSLPLGALAAFILYVGMLFGGLRSTSFVLDSMLTAFAAARKIADFLDGEQSVPESSDPIAPPLPLRGEVRLCAVSFGYQEGSREVADLDLVLRPGEVAAMLGSTGAGKSTIAKLIARFYDPTSGRVLLDGIDLKDLAEVDLRSMVVLLTQEMFLFSGTIADNIRLSRPDATDQEVTVAATAVGAHPFIAALPEGYATHVHQRGTRLSAGQRQLIAFARAFLADPAVVILDEATASLDIPTERTLHQALRTLLSGRTALIIAHRLSSLDITDRVLVIEGGRIIDDDTPARLLAKGAGAFAALYRDAHGQPRGTEDPAGTWMPL